MCFSIKKKYISSHYKHRCCSTALVDIGVMAALTKPDIILSVCEENTRLERQRVESVVVVVAKSAADNAPPTGFLPIRFLS